MRASPLNSWTRIACALCLAVVSLAGAQDVPDADGWVTDLGDMLGASAERELETLMESYRQGSGHEIALLTIPSLGNRSLERYALDVGRAWKLGQVNVNDGALLLVARDDRKVRIEVGRGLEGSITDAISSRVIRDVITPRFKAGDFEGGMRAGLEALHAAAGGDYAVLERKARSPKHRRQSSGVIGLLVLFIVLRTLGGSGRGGGRGGGGWLPWWIASSMWSSSHGHSRGGQWNGTGGFGGGSFGGGGGFGGFGGGGGFSGGGASGGW